MNKLVRIFVGIIGLVLIVLSGLMAYGFSGVLVLIELLTALPGAEAAEGNGALTYVYPAALAVLGLLLLWMALRRRG